MADFKDKTIVITGASRGIGEATARHFALLNANVVLLARTESDIKRIAQDIEDAGGQATAITCDVSQYEEVRSAFDNARRIYGAVDILVNNAGLIDPVSRLSDSDPDAWSKIVDINYKGVYFGLREAIPVMLDNGGGTIINISSGAATSALEGWSHYCSTKAAVLMLTRCADKEYGDQGINVIGLSPGTVATNMQHVIKDSGINPVSQLDWSKHIPAEWVAQSIAFLCGPDGKEFKGNDFSLKNDEGRARVGLPEVA